MRTVFRSHVAAALLLLPVSAAFVAAPVAAQSRNAYSIYEVALTGSGGLQVGQMLFLRVIGTPGATGGEVTLGSSGIRVALTEQSPGAYTGSHTIRDGDRIDPRQPIVARLVFADGSKTRNGAFPPAFQALGRPDARPERPERPERPHAERPERPPVVKPAPPPPRPAPPVATAPTIERFAVAPNNVVNRDSTLRFTLTGEAKADAFLEIPGVVKKVDLKETRPGTYEGSYTVRRKDELKDFDKAVATLRKGKLQTTAQLDLKAGEDKAERPRETRPDGATRPDGTTRPDRGTRPDGTPRPPRENRPDGEARPPRADRPDGEARPPRTERPDGEPRRNRDGRNPQVAP
ncbi:hypothetical protein HK414_23690 [Ramlibacter terrae]|uniref:Uncharacterized protein n=1 Tax=Ramlibacter terrae TaxID=2732511 RepID=A0ABX6P8K9_9BURK|nr:hypothetical protein HK414_23690 [Ramlibacter terrae]